MRKFCTNCGQEIDENISFCPNCGKLTKKNNIEKNKVENKKDSEKNKIAAGLLGIFLGGFGIHNFYLGYNGRGVAQLLMTLLSGGVLSFISSLWGFIEGIMIFTGKINIDAHGNPLGE